MWTEHPTFHPVENARRRLRKANWTVSRLHYFDVSLWKVLQSSSGRGAVVRIMQHVLYSKLYYYKYSTHHILCTLYYLYTVYRYCIVCTISNYINPSAHYILCTTFYVDAMYNLHGTPYYMLFTIYSTIYYMLFAIYFLHIICYSLFTAVYYVLCTTIFIFTMYHIQILYTMYNILLRTMHYSTVQHYWLFWLVTYSSSYQSCSGWTSSSVSFGKRHHAAAQQPVERYDLFSLPWWKRFFFQEPNMVLQSKAFLYI